MVHPVAACVLLDPASVPGWRLSFAGSFDQLDAYNGKCSRWQTHFVSGQRTIAEDGEREIYVDPACTSPTGAPSGLNSFNIEDGVLTISAWEPDAALRAKSGVADTRCLCGMLMTANSFQQTNGYLEINAKMPVGEELWPAFWLLPPGGRWYPEIDVLEVFGQQPDTVYVSVHTAGTGRHKATTKTVPDTSRGVHRFGVLWTANSRRWLFDGCR
jgi:beta-glucanase (GH16 family)